MKKYALPILFFALIGILLGYALQRMQTGEYSPSEIPSPLIGKPVPAFELPRVNDMTQKINNKNLEGQVYLLNVWASWCVACRQEHPLLMEVAKQKLVPIIGLDYKDKMEDALGFLTMMGNPYTMSLADLDGRVGIDLGVYGVPETFVIDKTGIVRYKHIGPISQQALLTKIMPIVKAHSKVIAEQPAAN